MTFGEMRKNVRDERKRPAVSAYVGNGSNQYVHVGGSERARATDARGAHRVDSSTDLSGTQHRVFLMNPKSGDMVVSRNFTDEQLDITDTDQVSHAVAADEAGLNARQYDQYTVHGYIHAASYEDEKDTSGGHLVRVTRYTDNRDAAKTSDEKHALLNKLTSHGISKESKFTSGYRPRPIHEELKTLAGGPAAIGGFAFDRTDPDAVQAVRDQAADLVKGVSQATRDDIKELVEKTFTDPSLDVHDLADQIEEIVDDKQRAETIARTEVMKAANEGQLSAWTQAEEEGLLTGNEQKEWITTPDDRLCPICEPMDGVTVPLDEDFDVDGDQIDGPPAHPNCRCTLGLSV